MRGKMITMETERDKEMTDKFNQELKKPYDEERFTVISQYSNVLSGKGFHQYSIHIPIKKVQCKRNL